MKTIFRFVLFIILISVSNVAFSQITILDAVAVDGDGDGYYGTVEIRFSTNIDDSDVETSAITENEWIFSLDPAFSDSLYADDFYSTVSHIANDNDNNDDYIQFVFTTTQFASSSGPIYIRYTNSNSTVITDQATTDTLFNFTLYASRDLAPPVIASVSSNATVAGALKIGQSITFTVDFEDAVPDPYLTILPLQYNGQNLNWSTSNAGDTYIGIYTVVENDQDRITPLQLTGVTAEDKDGNISTSFNGTDVAKTIDAHKPVILGVTSSASGTGALKVGETITFTVDVQTTELGLTILPSQYNGRNLNWAAVSGGDTYQGTYTVTEGDQDRVTALQLTGVTATDIAGNISSASDGSDVTVLIDAHTPSINTVTSDATAAGTLKIGDKINFTVDIVGSDGTLTVSPTTYNGQPLNWSTTDGGNTYKGVYTVVENDADRTTALQLTGVTVTDSAGNVSTPSVSGSDVVKLIDAHKPVISTVFLKDESKKIGDQDTLYITIASDMDYLNYTFISGTVAGYPVSSIQPVNNTTINAYFTITARTYEIDSSDNVQVSNLQLADGAGNLSNIINTAVANDNHAIFSRKPSADISGSNSICDKDSVEVPVFLTGHAPFSFTYTDGTTLKTISSINSSLYKLIIVADKSIGNPINYTVTNITDATGNANSSVAGPYVLTIFTLPNAYFTSPTDGNTFDISIDSVHLSAFPGGAGSVFSGDAVIPAYEMFSPEIAGVGPHTLYYNYTDANGCKDADTISVEVIEGGTITFLQGKDIYCSYTDSFTVVGINNLGLTGIFTLEGDPGGAILDLGNDTAIIYPALLSAQSYTITYEYGIFPDIVYIRRSFSIEEVSNTITFTSIGNKCEDYERIIIEAKNLSPLGGTGYFTLSDAGINLHKTNNGNNIYIEEGDMSPGMYLLEYYYKTINGCYSDTIPENFTVYSLPPVNLTMESLYDINGGTHVITGSPIDIPGDFSPSFMIDQGDGTAIFDPEIAGLGNKEAYYTYTDINGCTNTDTAKFTINESEGDIYGLNVFNSNYQYCYYNSTSDTIWAVPLNGDGLPGSFYIDGNLVTNVVGTDSIAINPSEIASGNHSLRFSYTNGAVVFNIDKTFNVDSIGNLDIIGLEDNYCKDDDREIVLTGIYTGDPGVGIFTGNGTSGNKFVPSDANLYDNKITYTFTRTYSGCQRSIDSTITVNKVPYIKFDLDKTCISGREDSVLFTADTLMSDHVVSWNWSVDNTITNKLSTLETPKFSLVQQVKNYIILSLTTDMGCTAEKDSSIFIGSVVDLDFKWDNECFGESVNFEAVVFTDPTGVDSIKWHFGGDGVANMSNPYNPQFTYNSSGGYDVTYQEYTGSCGIISETKRINIRPSIDLSEDSYYEDFEESPDITGWAVDILESTNCSWDWGTPAGIKINSAPSGTKAFVTNLDGNYNNNEKSIISSPCYDFSNIDRPMMKFDFISDLELNRDAVLLEYSVVKDVWNAIGVYGEGVKWYNSFNITGSVIGQSSGWTGNGYSLNTAETSAWNNAKYWLDDIKGEAGVRFRFVLGSDSYNTAEGFAIDNVWIGERNRMVLLEHFANPAEDDFENTQSIISNILNENPKDVISVQYYTSFPSMNEINEFYAAGPSARSLYYGVTQVPYSILDGGDRKFNYSSTNTLESSDINRRMLEDSKFRITIEQEQQGENLAVSAKIKAVENITGTKVNVFVALVEKTVVGNSNTYKNVLRALLPDAAGTLIERDWSVGDSIFVTQSWNIPAGIDADSITTVVFVQDENSKEIYQAAFADTLSTITAIDDFINNIMNPEIIVYPNPAYEEINIKLNDYAESDLNVELYNNIGMVVKSTTLLKGENVKSISVQELISGIYYLKVQNNTTSKSIKILIAR